MSTAKAVDLPPIEDMLKEFESGSIPRSETWQTLIASIYLIDSHVNDIEQWYEDIQAIHANILVIQEDVTERYDQIQVWHGEVDTWQQQVSDDKDAAASSAAKALASEQAAAASETNAANSESDAAESASAAEASETNAADSESVAAGSASAAATSEANAADSETAAAGSASAAATSETNAADSETAAAESASAAATSETNAADSETAAAGSASAAATSETGAATSETGAATSEEKARQWAIEEEDVEVEPGQYSAYHWAQKAEEFVPEETVLSVNGETGKVVLDAADVGARPDDYVPGWDDVTGKPDTFPPRDHVHDWSDITNPPDSFSPGMIMMWSGTEEQIPDGWQLCNGEGTTSNGINVPDLQDRFVVGSGSTYATGDTGGSDGETTSSNGSHSHTVTVESDGGHSHTVTVDGTTLSESQIAGHRHGVLSPDNLDDDYAIGIGQTSSYGASGLGGPRSFNNAERSYYLQDRDSQYLLDNSGGSSSHTHTASTNSTGSHDHDASSNTTGNHSHTVDTLPPYYGLAYIIKL